MKIKRGGVEYDVVKPQPLVDHYGMLITVGSLVVFNYGGDLMRGVVVELKENKHNLTWAGNGKYALQPYIMVKRFVDRSGRQDSKLSKVTHPHSIIVLVDHE